MGKALSIMWRPFRDFNLESRAHKVISKETAVRAPKYQSDQKDYQQILKDNPNLIEETLRKDANLDNYLKDVYVVSQDPIPKAPAESSSASKPLPLNRTTVEDFEFGFREPKNVPYGKVTLKTALNFIKNHQLYPLENTISKIAEDHKLPEETVSNIVKNFRIYEVYIPEEKTPKATFVGPLVPRKIIVTHKPKKLPSGQND